MATSRTTSTTSSATARQAKGSAKDVAQDAKQKAAETTDAAKQKAVETAEQAKRKTKSVAQTAKSEAKDLAADAKSTAKGKAKAAKETTADVASDAAPVLNAAADELRDQGHDAFARYAEQAADGVEQFTSTIRDKSVGELLDEAERFARREPGLFVGGAFLLGVMGARFLKAGAGNGGSGASASTRSASTSSASRSQVPQRAGLRRDTLDALASPTGASTTAVSGPGSGALPGATTQTS